MHCECWIPDHCDTTMQWERSGKVHNPGYLKALWRNRKPKSNHMPALQCCQPCGFPINLGLFFWGVACFLKASGLLVFGLVVIEIFLFFGLVFCRFLFCGLFFFQILWHFSCFTLLLKTYWTCFYENLLILGLFSQICLPAFYLIFLLIFCFVEFSCQRMLGFFRLNYVFLTCFSNSLACFCKITWHHCGAGCWRHKRRLKTSLRFVIALFANLGDLDDILQLGISEWHSTFCKS